MAKVVSANRLRDGAVVFLGAAKLWVESIDEAVVYDGPAELEAALTEARADEACNQIVDPFAVEVAESPGGLRAQTLRDNIRARGPTIDFLPASSSISTAKAI